MEYRKSMRPAVGGDVATIFVAIELSTKSWLVALQTSLQDRPSRHQLAARDVGGLMALIERVRSGLVERGVRRMSSPTGCAGMRIGGNVSRTPIHPSSRTKPKALIRDLSYRCCARGQDPGSLLAQRPG